MFIEEIILDGFKSYSTRTVISGFDPKFNAITGLNGSGKSNILDAICFVLGISNLSQVRVSNLQELVYKQGQAGITKASVTIVFNNKDSSQSPVGYDQYDTITVCRQIVIGGRNKYLINGHVVQLNQVQNLFHSVQLNVNNPHFLIMQGRITKVINMKPQEILGMIEEAAGTRMYETKKQSALLTIEKKQSKVDEINRILKDEITPTLERLAAQKAHYLKWSANKTECDRLNRFLIAYQYTQAKRTLCESKSVYDELKNEVLDINKTKTDLNEEITLFDEKMKLLSDKTKEEVEKSLEKIADKEEKLSKELVSKYSEMENTQKSIDEEKKNIDNINKKINENNTSINKLQNELETKEKIFREMENEHKELENTIKTTQIQLQSAEAGMSIQKDATESLAEQLKKATEEYSKSKANEYEYSETIKHKEKEKKRLEKELSSHQVDLKKLSDELKETENIVETAKVKLTHLKYNQNEHKQTIDQLKQAQNQYNDLRDEYEDCSNKLSYGLQFNYQSPSPNFDRSKVKGVVANLITVKDVNTATALEVVAGGRLYNVVVDTSDTGKLLLSKGKLKQKVTIIPLDKINHRILDGSRIQNAQKIAGGGGGNNNNNKKKVNLALDLIGYNEELQAAMEYIFGTTLVCDCLETAKKVTFDRNVLARSVTLEGDAFSPQGTLQGGSAPTKTSLLLSLQHLNDVKIEIDKCDEKILQLKKKIENFEILKSEYNKWNNDYELKSHQLELLRNRLNSTEVGQMQIEYDNYCKEIEENKQKLKQSKEDQIKWNNKIKELNNEITNYKKNRDNVIKAIENTLKTSKSKLEKSDKSYRKMKEEYDMKIMEINQLKIENETYLSQVENINKIIAEYNSSLLILQNEYDNKKKEYTECKDILDDKKNRLLLCNKEIEDLNKSKENKLKELENCDLQLKKIEHKINRLDNDQKAAEKQQKSLLNKNPWIEQDEKYFGEKNTDYDFNSKDINNVSKRLKQLEEEQESLNRKINKKVMGMIEQATNEYQDLLKKRDTVEKDKAKIQQAIDDLDKKKEVALNKTWKKVNDDFGSIFGTLLPGTTAMLVPVNKDDISAGGLEVKVAFSGKFKDSLSELSGGQKSLLALSLVLAMLKYKPAPMYILDEVDAALDLSHTQNIGVMLRKHFQSSQFIVVSLKEGMFNNANVVFRTKFVDGVSTVTRTLGRKTS